MALAITYNSYWALLFWKHSRAQDLISSACVQPGLNAAGTHTHTHTGLSAHMLKPIGKLPTLGKTWMRSKAFDTGAEDQVDKKP